MRRKTTKTTILPSENIAWGFYRTILQSGAGKEEANYEWKKMFRRCRKAGLSAESCRGFLDSRVGRHLADQVVDRKGSTSITVAELKRNYIDWWKREGGQAWTR